MKTWKPNFVGSNPIKSRRTGKLNDVLLQALASEVTGKTSSPRRVIVFSSNLDATVEISFVAPARFGRNEICLAVVDDARARFLKKSGLEALFQVMSPTHIILCRYWGTQLSDIMQLAQDYGAATLSFLDDNLLGVPIETGNNVFSFFQDKERRNIIERTIKDVDLFVPSTPFLSEDLSVYRPGPITHWGIYRSADPAEFLNDGFLNPRSVIGYMASESHAADLEGYIPALVKLLESRPEIRMEFFGTIRPPEALKVFGSRIIVRNKANSYADFMQRLKRLRWAIGIAPLADIPFNRTKACTKWVEYTLAGIPTLATSRDVYGRAADYGAVAMASPDTFLDALVTMLDDQDLCNRLLAASRELMAAEYRLDSHFMELKRVLGQATEISTLRLMAHDTAVFDEIETGVTRA